MDARVDAMSETDIVGEFVQFAVNRNLARIRARIGRKRKSVIGRDHRIRNDKAAIEEELQNRDAGPRNRPVSGGV